MPRPDDGEDRFGMRASIPTWEAWLDEFNDIVWPMFRVRGYSRTSALLAWELNRVVNRLDEMFGDDDREPWQG